MFFYCFLLNVIVHLTHAGYLNSSVWRLTIGLTTGSVYSRLGYTWTKTNLVWTLLVPLVSPLLRLQTRELTCYHAAACDGVGHTLLLLLSPRTLCLGLLHCSAGSCYIWTWGGPSIGRPHTLLDLESPLPAVGGSGLGSFCTLVTDRLATKGIPMAISFGIRVSLCKWGILFIYFKVYQLHG